MVHLTLCKRSVAMIGKRVGRHFNYDPKRLVTGMKLLNIHNLFGRSREHYSKRHLPCIALYYNNEVNSR